MQHIKQLVSFFVLSLGSLLFPLASFAASAPGCASLGSRGECTSVSTAFGTINTNVGSLAGTVLTILLSLSGGVAILLIVAAGYELMVSQGNPEKVKAGRERLTAAIVGLIFIIFSVWILQFIGVTILQLPGLGK